MTMNAPEATYVVLLLLLLGVEENKITNHRRIEFHDDGQYVEPETL